MDDSLFITLADGTSLSCRSTMADLDVEGELVFTTAYPGYTQSLTDPSYRGQILIFAFPSIGIYGLDEEDFQSKRPWVEAVVVHNLEDLNEVFVQWLSSWNIPLITSLDCRGLILHLRESGSQMARINRSGEAPVAATVSNDLVASVSTEKVQVIGDGKTSVALMDYGVKDHIVRNLVERGCKVTLFPNNSSAEEVLAIKPDGIFLSNGPGDPAVLHYEIEQIKKMAGKVPVFGICLGCQLLSLACGARTEKLSYGHRGANQPVMDIARGRAIVTSQNHGYAVDESSLEGTDLEVTFRHLGDGTIEGVRHSSIKIGGVQFHPEAGAGPLDALYLFDDFISSITEREDA